MVLQGLYALHHFYEQRLLAGRGRAPRHRNCFFLNFLNINLINLFLKIWFLVGILNSFWENQMILEVFVLIAKNNDERSALEILKFTKNCKIRESFTTFFFFKMSKKKQIVQKILKKN